MKTLVLFALVIASISLAPVEAVAQQVKVDVKDINVETMQTPQFAYDGESKKLPSAKEWVEIEVEFEAEGTFKDGFVPELEFTFYVVMDDEAKTMLVERVTYVNILQKEEIFANVFVSPTTVMKLTGSEATSSSVVAGVAVEIRFQGALVGGDTTQKSGGSWWQTRPQTAGMLLRKSRTPFAILWTDRYAEIKSEK